MGTHGGNDGTYRHTFGLESIQMVQNTDGTEIMFDSPDQSVGTGYILVRAGEVCPSHEICLLHINRISIGALLISHRILKNPILHYINWQGQGPKWRIRREEKEIGEPSTMGGWSSIAEATRHIVFVRWAVSGMYLQRVVRYGERVIVGVTFIHGCCGGFRCDMCDQGTVFRRGILCSRRVGGRYLSIIWRLRCNEGSLCRIHPGRSWDDLRDRDLVVFGFHLYLLCGVDGFLSFLRMIMGFLWL